MKAPLREPVKGQLWQKPSLRPCPKPHADFQRPGDGLKQKSRPAVPGCPDEVQRRLPGIWQSAGRSLKHWWTEWPPRVLKTGAVGTSQLPGKPGPAERRGVVMDRGGFLGQLSEADTVRFCSCPQ